MSRWRLLLLFILVARAASGDDAPKPAAKSDLLSEEHPTVRKFPSLVDPWHPLRLQDTSNDALAQSAIRLAKRLHFATNALDKNMQENTLSRVRYNDIAATYVASQRLARAANMLAPLNEVAAADFAAMASRAADVSRRAGVTFSQLPGFPEPAMRERAKLARNLALARFPAIEQYRNAGNLEQAEQELFPLLERIEFYAVWMNGPDFGATTKPFLDTHTSVMEELKKKRHDATQAQLEKLRGESAAAFHDLKPQILAAAKQLTAGTSAKWEGKPLKGPKIIDALREPWRQLQHRAQRLAATDQLLGGTPVKDPAAPLLEYNAYSQGLWDAIATLIASDAVDALPGDAIETHAAYLQSLAALMAECGLKEPPKAIEEALAALAQRDASFAKKVADYKLATGDVLQWRQRVARSRSVALEPKWPNSHTKLTMLMGRAGVGPPLFRGGDYRYYTVLEACAAECFQNRSPALIGQQLTLADLHTRREGGGAPLTVARFRDRVYGTLAPPSEGVAEIAAEVNRLKADLLVDEKNAPLSLPAALAIYQAESECWEKAGATIGNITAEPATIKLMHWLNYEFDFLPLMEPPPRIGDPLTELLLRVDGGEPAWVQHRYFFVDLSKPKQ